MISAVSGTSRMMAAGGGNKRMRVKLQLAPREGGTLWTNKCAGKVVRAKVATRGGTADGNTYGTDEKARLRLRLRAYLEQHPRL